MKICPQVTVSKGEEYLRYYLLEGMSNDLLIMPRYWSYSTPPEERGIVKPIERPLPCLEQRAPSYEVIAPSLEDAVATVNYIATAIARDTDYAYVRVLAPETETKASFAEGVEV
jgi:hypothetical protein